MKRLGTLQAAFVLLLCAAFMMLYSCSKTAPPPPRARASTPPEPVLKDDEAVKKIGFNDRALAEEIKKTSRLFLWWD